MKENSIKLFQLLTNNGVVVEEISFRLLKYVFIILKYNNYDPNNALKHSHIVYTILLTKIN